MNSRKSRGGGVAFLLAQLGAHAADLFRKRIEVLGISPSHAGILRIIARSPALNQQDLAKKLGVMPSRMVILIDELTERGLVERKRSTEDRRKSELALTKLGNQTLERLSKVAAEHEADLCAGLTVEDRSTLATLCRKIATQQGLTPDVHPGYRRL